MLNFEGEYTALANGVGYSIHDWIAMTANSVTTVRAQTRDKYTTGTFVANSASIESVSVAYKTHSKGNAHLDVAKTSRNIDAVLDIPEGTTTPPRVLHICAPLQHHGHPSPVSRYLVLFLRTATRTTGQQRRSEASLPPASVPELPSCQSGRALLPAPRPPPPPRAACPSRAGLLIGAST